MTKFSTISNNIRKLYVTESFATASSVLYNEFRRHFSNSELLEITVLTVGTQADEAVPAASLSKASPAVQAGIGLAHRPLAQRPRIAGWALAEPGGSCRVLVAHTPIGTGRQGAHSAVALDNVLAGQRVRKQVHLVLVEQEVFDAAA